MSGIMVATITLGVAGYLLAFLSGYFLGRAAGVRSMVPNPWETAMPGKGETK